MNRLLLAALSLVLVIAPAHAAQFEGVLEMKISSGAIGAQGAGKTYLSKVGWRTEMEVTSPEMARAGAGKSFRTTMFAKFSAPDTIYNVNDEAKTYGIIDAKEMRERAARKGADEAKYTVKRLGKDKVAGFGCEKVELTQADGSQQIEACLSNEIMGVDWARQFGHASHGGDWMKAARKAGVDGFPLRIVSMTRDTPESKQVMEVTKIERRAVPASMFEVPQGYTKTSAVAAFGQNADQAKQLEQMQKAMQNLSPEQRKMLENMMKGQAK